MKYTLLRAAIKSKNIKQPYTLKDCDVVIDGRTYFRLMYRNSGCQFVIGGEYDRFGSYVRNQLKTLIDSNVTCYVIFNGGMKAEVEKRKKIHQGIIDKTDAVLPSSDDNEYCEPIFVNDVCKEVLKDLGIKFFVAEYDSREAILTLAKKLRCPVLTSSFEYCMYGVSCITPKSLSYDKARRNISCRIFPVQDCNNAFRLRYELVPIFLTLMDEDGDYIKRLPEIKARRRSKLVMAVFFWIRRQTQTSAFKAIEQSLQSEAHKNEFRYSYLDNFNLRNSRNSLAIAYFGILSKYFKTNSKSFENAVADGTVAIPYVNLKNNSTFSGSQLIVDKNKEDAMLPAMDIVKYVYGTLTQSTNGKIAFIGRKSGKSDVWEMEWTYDEPVPKVSWKKGPVQRNSFQRPEDHVLIRRFLEKTLPGFKFEKLQLIPEDSWMIMIALVYYCVKRELDIYLVSSILLSYVMVGLVSERIGVIKRINLVVLSNADHDDDKPQEVSRKDCETAAKKLVDLFDAADIKRKFNRSILHTLAEFQHCLQHMNYLNKLCGETIQCTVYHKVLNILFVYKAYVKMAKHQSDPMRYFEKCLGNSSSVLKYFKKLQSVFDDCFSSAKK